LNDESRLQLERYLKLVDRRKLVLLVPVVLAVLGAALLSFLQEPVYVATAQTRVDIEAITGVPSQEAATANVLNTYSEIIQTNTFLNQVAKDLSLSGQSAELHGRVTTKPVPESEIINIEARASDPDEAVAIANRVVALLDEPDFMAQFEPDATAAPNAFLVTETASPPGAPISPRWSFNLLAGLLAGLAAGVALSLVLEYIDPTLRGVRDLESVTRLPVLASIPFGVRWKYPPPPVSPDYRLLSTKLRTLLQNEAHKTVLFTSTRPEEGNTTVATYAAMAMAQSGMRTLLLDANLNRPDIHKLFNLPMSPGLFNILSLNGSRPSLPLAEAIDELVQESPVPRLSVLTAGTKMSDPSELLASAEMRAFLDAVESKWDAVIVDGSAMSSGAGAAVIAPVVAGVVLVAAEGQASSTSVEETVGELASLGAKTLGLVYCKAVEA
jgi:capsular exopolysaccharide synthesis family protein